MSIGLSITIAIFSWKSSENSNLEIESLSQFLAESVERAADTAIASQGSSNGVARRVSVIEIEIHLFHSPPLFLIIVQFFEFLLCFFQDQHEREVHSGLHQLILFLFQGAHGKISGESDSESMPYSKNI